MSITVTISGLGGRSEVELQEGATVGDARQAGQIDAGLQIRSGGHPVGDDAALADGQQLVTAPPSAKHGAGS